MTNFEIYKKTLPFALWRIVYSLLGLLVMVGLPVGAFLLTRGNEQTCVIVTSIAAVIGIVLFAFLARYLSYMLKAGQIAMITEGVSEGEMPDNVLEAGKEAVKTRFVAANVYFGLQSLIKGITSELTRGITGVAGALGSLGGESGRGVGTGIGSAISAFVEIVLEYVNYCCLGWVFRNKGQNAFKSTCDGAVIYFQNWKVLLKNAAKVIGISLLSLVVIGGPLTVLFRSLIGTSRGLIQLLAAIATEMEIETSLCVWCAAAVGGVLVWGVIHGALVKPYILVSVLRKYMEAAEETPPKVDIYGKLCKLSRKFRKAFDKSGETIETTEAEPTEA